MPGYTDHNHDIVITKLEHFSLFGVHLNYVRNFITVQQGMRLD
jgi:hypothetical protein